MEKIIQPECIPTKDEIIEIIKRHAENAIVTRELYDENGIYLLELKTEGEKPGKSTTPQQADGVCEAQCRPRAHL